MNGKMDLNNIQYKSKVKRNYLINLLILKYDKRINKSFDELMDMKATEISVQRARARHQVIKLFEDFIGNVTKDLTPMAKGAIGLSLIAGLTLIEMAKVYMESEVNRLSKKEIISQSPN